VDGSGSMKLVMFSDSVDKFYHALEEGKVSPIGAKLSNAERSA
jgi:hypothetical protein